MKISCHTGNITCCVKQSSVFDANNEVWIPRNVKCLGLDMQVSLSKVSDESVEKFVKTLE